MLALKSQYLGKKEDTRSTDKMVMQQSNLSSWLRPRPAMSESMQVHSKATSRTDDANPPIQTKPSQRSIGMRKKLILNKIELQEFLRKHDVRVRGHQRDTPQRALCTWMRMPRQTHRSERREESSLYSRHLSSWYRKINQTTPNWNFSQ